MIAPVDPGTITAAVQMGRAAFQNSPAIVRLFRKTKATWLRRRFGGEKILVVGRGGSGKTTLHRIITGKTEQASHPYRQTNFIERGAYNGSVFGEVFTFPGQDNPFSSAIPSGSAALVRNVQKSVTGIILVVCNGYNSLPPGDHRFKPEEIIKRNLELENTLVSSLCETLDDFTRLAWILIAINKRDLWYGDQVNCMKQYSRLQNRLSKAVVSRNSSNQINVSICPLSLMSSIVVDHTGAPIFTINPLYDDLAREADVNSFYARLDELARYDQ